jgi:hypothetical protein
VSLLSLWRVVCDHPGCNSHIGRRAGTALDAIAAARTAGWHIADVTALALQEGTGDLCPRHNQATPTP